MQSSVFVVWVDGILTEYRYAEGQSSSKRCHIFKRVLLGPAEPNSLRVSRFPSDFVFADRIIDVMTAFRTWIVGLFVDDTEL